MADHGEGGTPVILFRDAWLVPSVILTRAAMMALTDLLNLAAPSSMIENGCTACRDKESVRLRKPCRG
jgi:hypothetical protein